MSTAIILSPMSAMETFPNDGDEAFMTAEYQQAIQDSMMNNNTNTNDQVPSSANVDENDNGNTTTAVSDNASIPSLRDDDDHDEEMMMMDDSTKNEEEPVPLEKNGIAISDSYGGLRNLGNTCYMASALQLLSGLDRFVSRLESTDIPEEKRNELRTEFLEMMKRLRSGETIEPKQFKEAMDTRSPLFIGYRQQDSHEFLTTLLDLLDNDYQVKEEEKEEDKKEEEKDVDSGDGDTLQAQQSDGAEIGESRDDHDELVDESTLAPIEEEEEQTPSSPLRSSPSFSKLTVDEISRLLHGSKDEQQKEPSATTTTKISGDSPTDPVVCKLVGGRAVVPQDSLVPFTNEATVNNEPTKAPLGTTATVDEPVIEAATATETKTPSPIEEYFATEVRACLTCDSCKYTRSHTEKFLHLSLDVSAESNIDDGLRKFFAPERREIKCEKCFGESATQTLEIVKLPRAMLLHLKRFIVDVSPDYTSITYRKDQSAVEYRDSLSLDQDVGVLGEFLAKDATVPEALDRPSFLLPPADDDDASMSDAEERSYKIRSIVNHIGSSAQCGHYTSDAFRTYSDGTRQWTRFNDSMVDKTLSKDTAMGSTTTAYMIMYELD